MKLFIWNEPYKISYGGSILFVVAENLEEAKRIAPKVAVSSYGFILSNQTFGCRALGEPTRILDLPGGECYEWSE